jgi:tetratricopeptide (TPR) repeat protein
MAEGDGDFDLAAELSGIGGDEPVRTLAGTEEEGFEQVFNAFKSGVERELGDGDHEARYDLGIAYKEMGLLDDAIGEFRIAMQVEARRLSCLHMLGLCALELGRTADAAAHLEQALSLPDLPDDQRVPLRYDLARAYSVQGDVERARAGFEAVRAADPSFGDVERELALLATRATTKTPEPAEAYESFDDLLAEDSGTPVAADPPTYESFDDLFSDDAADASAAELEVDPDTDVEPDPAPEPEAAPRPDPSAAFAEPAEEAPLPEPEPVPAAAPAPSKKRRKISFF